jgi:hypothetical protein
MISFALRGLPQNITSGYFNSTEKAKNRRAQTRRFFNTLP